MPDPTMADRSPLLGPAVGHRRSQLLQYLDALPDPVLLNDAFGNVGDALIRAGTRDLLTGAGIGYEEVSGLGDVDDPTSRALLVRGSGGFDRYFHAALPSLVRQAAALFRHVVILPSSYDPSVPEVRAALSQPNVTPLAREWTSARRIAHIPGAFASVDCAAYCARLERRRLEGDRGGAGRLVALRTDHGSLIRAAGLQPRVGVNEDVSLSAAGLDAWLERIGAADQVVTDRLHVALASVLLGRPVVLIEAYGHKLRGYFEYVFDAVPVSAQWRDTPWLVEQGLVGPTPEPALSPSGGSAPPRERGSGSIVRPCRDRPADEVSSRARGHPGRGDVTPSVVAVVGMHRSGTSALTEALARAGLELSNADRLLGPSDSNPRGHFEDADLVRVDDWLLGQHDASWDDPWGILGAVVDQDEVLHMAHEWDSMAASGRFLIKDPRLCLTLPWWRRVWPEDSAVVVIVRDPCQVADSLARRNAIPEVLGELLWYAYVSSTIRATRTMRVEWVEHGALMADPQGQVDRVIRGLDLDPGAGSRAAAAIDPGLAFTGSAREAVVPLVRDLWAQASRVAREGGQWTGPDPQPLPVEYVDLARVATHALHRAEVARHQLVLARHAVGEAQHSAAETAARLAHTELQRQDALAEAHDAREALSEVVSSTSWRLTEPGRAVGRWLRRR